jgi:transcriptional/translational regulatory protein YebC/TACO1
VSEEKLMEAAVEAGAEDYRDEEDVWVVYTPMEQLYEVTSALENTGIPIQESKIAYVPKNKKQVEGRDAEVCLNLVDALDDHDDVQGVFADFELSDEELARISGDD